MESYFDLTFCVVLSSNVLYEAFMEDLFLDYFSTKTDKFATIVTFLYILIMTIFLLYGYYITKQGSTQESIFLEGIKTKSKWQTKYHIIFLVRRTATTLILILMHKLPFFQCQILLWFSLANLCFLIDARPFVEKFDQI